MQAIPAIRRSPRSNVRSVAGIALFLCAVSFCLTMLACATPAPTASQESAEAKAAATSTSRCAPGRINDARHALCNGQSGRWW